jgi:hypothetical protein
LLLDARHDHGRKVLAPNIRAALRLRATRKRFARPGDADELGRALDKHGSALAIIIAGVEFRSWAIGQRMELCAMLAEELAEAEQMRRDNPPNRG